MRNRNDFLGFYCCVIFEVLLFIAFLILKLTQTIEWSWLWVFSPLWIPVAAAVIYATALSVYAVAIAIITGLDR